ncbi:hypothetical protein E4T50_01466 [Aureobasidium sp. EXF-12298]|nr:hypothetical protein E4T50_01466 [Aureobasidium sp. EXF-12298]
MWIPQSPLHKLKIAVHLLQAIITFITGCMTLAILTEKGTHDSRVQWCFALVRLRCADHLLEHLILTTSTVFPYDARFDVSVPCWTRLWRLANPYIFFTIDSVFTVFWMSAFASSCAWTAKGMRKGAADKKLSANAASCSTFAFGSTSTCNLAKATTGLGVALWSPLTDWFSILFLVAAVISGMDTYKFWKSGTVRTKPEIYGQALSRASSPEGKDEWSLSTDDLHAAKGAYTSDVYQGWSHDNETEFMETETLEGPHPGRHVSCMSAKTIPYERDLTPSAMSPTVTETRYTGIFPPATANYSFSRE